LLIRRKQPKNDDMKKLIPFLALMALASGAYAQGTINFNNSVLTSPPDRLVRNFDGTALVGTQWGVQLYYGASESSLAAHTAAPQRFRVPTTTAPGTWATTGGTRTLTGGGVGVPVFVQARVWNLDQFATYEAALAAGGVIGTSTVFQYTQRLSPQPSPTDTYMDNFLGFSLVPEPSVIGLGVIGVGALLMLRRRK
jgi:hypothetical protein